MSNYYYYYLVAESASNGLLNGHLEQLDGCETGKHSKKRKHITEECVTNAASKQDETDSGDSLKNKKKHLSKPNVDEIEEESSSMRSVRETSSASLKANTDSLVQKNSYANNAKSIALKVCA